MNALLSAIFILFHTIIIDNKSTFVLLYEHRKASQSQLDTNSPVAGQKKNKDDRTDSPIPPIRPPLFRSIFISCLYYTSSDQVAVRAHRNPA